MPAARVPPQPGRQPHLKGSRPLPFTTRLQQWQQAAGLEILGAGMPDRPCNSREPWLHQLSRHTTQGQGSRRRQVERRLRRLTGSSAGAPVPDPGTPPPPGSAPPAIRALGGMKRAHVQGSTGAARWHRHPLPPPPPARPPVSLAVRSCPGCWGWPPDSATGFRRQARTFCRGGGSIVVAGRCGPPLGLQLYTHLTTTELRRAVQRAGTQNTGLPLAFCSAPAALPTARACSRRATCSVQRCRGITVLADVVGRAVAEPPPLAATQQVVHVAPPLSLAKQLLAVLVPPDVGSVLLTVAHQSALNTYKKCRALLASVHLCAAGWPGAACTADRGSAVSWVGACCVLQR